jgi:hypothetical protein
MRVGDRVRCVDFPCVDVNKETYIIPNIAVDPAAVRAMVVSEAAPQKTSDYYYAGGSSLFEETTVQAFRDTGLDVRTLGELVERGFYFTTAVKCGKVGYGVGSDSIRACSRLLEEEFKLFPELKVVMLMGDVAIKAFNDLVRRRGGKRVIPAGSTYKIRGTPYYYGGIRVFPSYLQAGPSFFIEKSKRRMIGEDIREALRILDVKV